MLRPYISVEGSEEDWISQMCLVFRERTIRIFPLKFFNCVSTANVLKESKKLALKFYFFLRSTTRKKMTSLNLNALKLDDILKGKKHFMLIGEMVKNKKPLSILILSSIKLFPDMFQYFIEWSSTIIPLSMVTYTEIIINTLTHFSGLPFRTDVS